MVTSLEIVGELLISPENSKDCQCHLKFLKREGLSDSVTEEPMKAQLSTCSYNNVGFGAISLRLSQKRTSLHSLRLVPW